MKLLTTGIALILTIGAQQANGDDGPFQFDFQQIGPGIWTGIRADSQRFPVMGNTTFVISDEGVVVFDGGGMPTMAEQIIEKVRSLTDKPVTHVVISHWHGDHNFGIFRFAEEFPNVQFIAHPFTNEVFNSSRITYIDRQKHFIENKLEEFKSIVATGLDAQGNEVDAADRRHYARIIEDAHAIEPEFKRAKVTPANIMFTDKYSIQSGDRTIDLLHLGHANTAGDIVMWLPRERVVATGDIVVFPSPYAFNVPPRAWTETLRALNALDYAVLVPGHGQIQQDSFYVHLIIEAVESIADQRDALLAQGTSHDETAKLLNFAAFENRFTQGDEYTRTYYEAYFVDPLRLAAMKALLGKPMVDVAPPESIPFDDVRWQIEALESERVNYLGRPALKLRGGTAVLADVKIENGLVEFDIAVSEQRGFAGLMFRLQDNANYEHFYVRPHQSGKPDANQYTPVFNGVSGWQLYHGEGFGAPADYAHDQWMHVKVLFAGTRAEVYIDSDEPLFRIDGLKRGRQGGALGLNSAQFSSVHFANFKFTALADAYEFPPTGKEPAVAAEGVVMSWQVSDVFDSGLLQGLTRLNNKHKSDRQWSELSAESTGITNLARLQGLGDGKDTVFARLQVSSDRATIKELTLGYSDAATVFVNDKRIYAGSNRYQSRDYRYLGTIGLFDRIAVPLTAGDNEIWIAVSEAFGGWGIMATLTDFVEPPGAP